MRASVARAKIFPSRQQRIFSSNTTIHTRPPPLQHNRIPPLNRLASKTSTMSISSTARSLIPSDPAKVMVIRDVTPNITTLSVPFLRFGHIKIGGRATLVKLQTGNVAVFSPVAFTPDVQAKAKSLGPIKYIVAPDIEHHIFVSTWAKEYPEAEVIGMEGLPEKRERDPATKGTKIAHVFSAKNKLDRGRSDLQPSSHRTILQDWA